MTNNCPLSQMKLTQNVPNFSRTTTKKKQKKKHILNTTNATHDMILLPLR